MLSVLDSDKRLADHFGGKVSYESLRVPIGSIGQKAHCSSISVITNFVTFLPPWQKSA